MGENGLSSTLIGKIGEDVAAFSLKEKGYDLLDRNFLEKFGEIDLITRDRSGVLVFVEAKTLMAGDSLKPEDNYSLTKEFRTKRICEAFANKHPEMIAELYGWRMDLICVEIPPGVSLSDNLTKIASYCEVRHYQNV